MKPLYWDMINPFTGRPFAYDDRNLKWGSPSYYLEPGDEGFVPYGPTPAPAPKKKPFRRQAKPHRDEPEPYTPPTMPTFKYHVAPNPHGGFTTRPVLSDPVPDSVFFDRAAVLSTSLTADQIRTALQAVVDTILECSTGCAFSNGLLGKLRFRPTSGGSSQTPGGFSNPNDLNADIAISLTAEVRDHWRSILSLESQGEIGKLSPVVDSILSQENGAVNKYTPGTLIEILGQHLDINKTDVQQGVFFRSGNSAEVRATIYGTLSPGSLSVLVPANLSGDLTVRVANHINGSIRSFTYMDVISPI